MTNLTIQSHERVALGSPAEITDFPPSAIEGALRRLVEAIPPGGRVLEVGSGTGAGADADFVEACGASVRRTDATRAFRDLQVARGKQVEPLDLSNDDLGGPYDGILALSVFVHISRNSTPQVLRKVAAALRPAGAFLVSVREGSGETDGAYLRSSWEMAEYNALLAQAGLRVDWHHRHNDCDGDTWLTFMARKAH